MNPLNIHPASVGRSQSSDSNSTLSRFSVINDTILDNMVSRFSLVNDHRVRGKWRTLLSVAVVFIPLFVFIFMVVWYSMLNCQPATMAVNDLMTASTTRKFLQGSQNHFCGAMYVDYTDDTDDTGAWVPCSLGKSAEADYSKFSTEGRYCSKFHKDFGKLTASDLSPCYLTTSNQFYSVMYVQCLDIGSIIVNAVQLTSYSVILTIYLYLTVRIINKFGFCGLFSGENWKKITSNKNWAKDSTTNIELSTV